jgi:small conductance mechanosensitive channel
VIVIPNGTLANTSLTNASTVANRQLDLEFSIGYQDDLEKAKEVLLAIGNREEKRIQEIPVSVFVKDLADSAVILGLRLTIPNENYWDIRWKTIETVKKEFDKEGISIPYPQLDIHKA